MISPRGKSEKELTDGSRLRWAPEGKDEGSLLRRGTSSSGTRFEILESLRWYHYVPIINILYDVFFDARPRRPEGANASRARVEGLHSERALPRRASRGADASGRA